MRKLNQRGFTIIELMIATSVFSVILLVCTATLLGVARYYQKGVTTNNTQEAARNAIDEISGMIRFDGGAVTYVPAAAPTPLVAPGFRAGAVCIGSTRFVFVLNGAVQDGAANLGQHKSKHAIWRDTMNTSTGCQVIPNVATQVTPSDALTATPGQELVPVNARVVDLTVLNYNTSLPTVNLELISGDDSVMNLGGAFPNLPTGCNNTLLGGQFCADSKLSEAIEKRL